MKYLQIFLVVIILCSISCEYIGKNPVAPNKKYWEYTIEDLNEITPNECPMCNSTTLGVTPTKDNYGFMRCYDCGYLWETENIADIKRILGFLLKQQGIEQPFDFKFTPNE